MITIDRESCTQCGLCAAVCTDNIIVYRPNSFPRQAPGFDAACLKCGHCVAVCPSGSLTHVDVPVEKCPPIKKNLTISAEQAEQFIRARRSVREFKERSVPREVIEN